MAVTVTYEHPVTGVTPPTALQAADKVVAVVTATVNGDLLATIVHNMGISTADLAAGFPEVLIEPMLPAGWTSTPHVLAGGKDATDVAVTMANAGGNANDQFRVTISHPHSIGR